LIQPTFSPERQKRRDLIAALEAERGTKIVTYVLSDRVGATAQIGEDAVRPMYDHLRAIGPSQKIDLFIYSLGGQTDVPWRIVSMFREYAEEFAVLVPYKAMSAATMIALGADEIVMGKKGELGPIDPTLSVQRGGDGGTLVQANIAAEDIMAYIRFLREKVGLTDQAALAAPMAALGSKLEPWILGQVSRAHSHIRTVARKLLTARSKAQSQLDEQRIQVIIETLAEKTYQHGHAIGRREAEEIGLNIVRANDREEGLLWDLFEAYEQAAKLASPIDARTFIPSGKEDHQEPISMAFIESLAMAHEYSGEYRQKNRRSMPTQLVINLNASLQIPPDVNAQQLPVAVQQNVQQLLQQLQQQGQALIQQQLMMQMPLAGIDAWVENSAWRRQPDSPPNPMP